jgi:hypothetical protein
MSDIGILLDRLSGRGSVTDTPIFDTLATADTPIFHAMTRAREAIGRGVAALGDGPGPQQLDPGIEPTHDPLTSPIPIQAACPEPRQPISSMSHPTREPSPLSRIDRTTSRRPTPSSRRTARSERSPSAGRHRLLPPPQG